MSASTSGGWGNSWAGSPRFFPSVDPSTLGQNLYTSSLHSRIATLLPRAGSRTEEVLTLFLASLFSSFRLLRVRRRRTWPEMDPEPCSISSSSSTAAAVVGVRSSRRRVAPFQIALCATAPRINALKGIGNGRVSLYRTKQPLHVSAPTVP